MIFGVGFWVVAEVEEFQKRPSKDVPARVGNEASALERAFVPLPFPLRPFGLVVTHEVTVVVLELPDVTVGDHVLEKGHLEEISEY